MPSRRHLTPPTLHEDLQANNESTTDRPSRQTDGPTTILVCRQHVSASSTWRALVAANPPYWPLHGLTVSRSVLSAGRRVTPYGSGPAGVLGAGRHGALPHLLATTATTIPQSHQEQHSTTSSSEVERGCHHHHHHSTTRLTSSTTLPPTAPLPAPPPSPPPPLRYVPKQNAKGSLHGEPYDTFAYMVRDAMSVSTESAVSVYALDTGLTQPVAGGSGYALMFDMLQ